MGPAIRRSSSVQRVFVQTIRWVQWVLLGVGLPVNLAIGVPAEGHRLMVAGPSPAAIEIAQDIATQGGNVVDVAVAVALSLAVTHPYYAALGGGGFGLIKTAKTGSEVRALDFREVAPKAASPEMFRDGAERASLDGGLAVGVPGIPAGLWELHRSEGKLPWKKLFSGAIRLAEDGFRVSGEWAGYTQSNRSRFTEAGLKTFFGKKAIALKPGDWHKQPALAKLLKKWRREGAKTFTQGDVVKDVVSSVRAHGGVMTAEDLADYKPRWLEPLKTSFGGYQIHLMPPPSSGGVIIAQALSLMERLKISNQSALSANEFHLLVEVMKLSFRGRTTLGDPAFTANPITSLTSESYLSDMAKRIKLNKAIDIKPLTQLKFEKSETTHFSVMDHQGHAVAMTITLNGAYGSAVVTDKYGLTLNNEMDDFTTRPGQPNLFGLVQGEANQVRAGARPLSSMSPTIVEKDGQTVLALGAPGGPRIITGVLQVLYRTLQQNFDVDQAIQAPRVHHQFMPNTVYIDDKRFSPEVVKSLEARGHKIDVGSTAKVYAIRLGPDGRLSGAHDSRGEGASGGF